MTKYKIMTPGPTQVSEKVLHALGQQYTNPDFDEEFVQFYKDTCLLISDLLHTNHESFILDGEGILGLEAAIASITEPDDRVLVLDNGIYGKGFADFVSMYQGKPVLLTMDYKKTIDEEVLRAYLEKDHDFKYATLVHCDTPSGMLNDVHKLCPILKEYGIMTVVDSVSAMFGVPLYTDQAQIDILCGGSQKALSAPPGLSFVTISDEAKDAILNRKTPIASFYANLAVFFGYYEKKWFPYTMPVNDIYGLYAALEIVKNDTDMIMRHKKIAKSVRSAFIDCGLSLYSENGYSDTVTVFMVPENVTDKEILSALRTKHHIMLAGSFDVFEGKVIRIGHMGRNANYEDVLECMEALDDVFDSLHVEIKGSLKENFVKYMKVG